MGIKNMPYELFSGKVINTGWPIDGHQLLFALWDFDKRSKYHLYDWEDDYDDEAVMWTMFRSLVDGGYICEEAKGEFITIWKDGKFDEVYYPCVYFCIELDQLTDVKKVDKED